MPAFLRWLNAGRGAQALTAGIGLFLAHHLSLLIHEWSHGTVAWVFHLKPHPFAIYYGDWTLLNSWEEI